MFTYFGLAILSDNPVYNNLVEADSDNFSKPKCDKIEENDFSPESSNITRRTTDGTRSGVDNRQFEIEEELSNDSISKILVKPDGVKED